MSDHFNYGICKDKPYTVQIIEKLPGNGRNARKALDPNVTAIRKSAELKWILKLRTVFPYGLNDRIGDEYKNDYSHNLVGNKFPSLKRSKKRLVRGTLHKGTNDSPFKFISDFKETLNNTIPDAMNFLAIRLNCFKKSNLKSIADLLNDEMSSNTFKLTFYQWYQAALDIISCKIYTPPLFEKLCFVTKQWTILTYPLYLTVKMLKILYHPYVKILKHLPLLMSLVQRLERQFLISINLLLITLM